MPPRDWRIRVSDILEAIARALAHVQGCTFEEFAKDARCVDAVSFSIVVIGEAASHLPDFVVQATPNIAWADMRGMRNRVAHEYFGIDLEVLWETVVEDLPQLQPSLRALLERNDLP